MSQQAVAEFFNKINTDAALQQELTAALEGKDETVAATLLVEVGAKHGYDFTAQEAAQKHQEIIAAAADVGNSDGEGGRGGREKNVGGARCPCPEGS